MMNIPDRGLLPCLMGLRLVIGARIGGRQVLRMESKIQLGVHSGCRISSTIRHAVDLTNA